jgi:hypothetical protein
MKLKLTTICLTLTALATFLLTGCFGIKNTIKVDEEEMERLLQDLDDAYLSFYQHKLSIDSETQQIACDTDIELFSLNTNYIQYIEAECLKKSNNRWAFTALKNKYITPSKKLTLIMNHTGMETISYHFVSGKTLTILFYWDQGLPKGTLYLEDHHHIYKLEDTASNFIYETYSIYRSNASYKTNDLYGCKYGYRSDYGYDCRYDYDCNYGYGYDYDYGYGYGYHCNDGY